MKVKFTLTGTMPLLMHSDDVIEADRLKEWRVSPENKNLSVPGDDRSPPWTWQTYLYHDGEKIVMPYENVMAGLRIAGAKMILKKQKTFKEISQSDIVPDAEFFSFTTSGRTIHTKPLLAIKDNPFKQQFDAVQSMGFRLFMKRARVGTAKHVRVRARFDAWEVSGSVNVTAPEITLDHLQTLFDLAGKGGLCDWRPACKTPGPWGMFTASLKKSA